MSTDLPNTYWLRRGDILRSNLGITRYAFRAALRRRKIQRVVLPGMSEGRYRRDEVLKAFAINP